MWVTGNDKIVMAYYRIIPLKILVHDLNLPSYEQIDKMKGYS